MIHAQREKAQVAEAEFLEAASRSRVGTCDERIAAGCSSWPPPRHRARGAGSAPWWAPACAKAGSWPAWQTPPPRPWAQTGSRATPLRKNMGTNTMQMASVETSAGVAICCGAIEDGLLQFLARFKVAVDVLDRHRGVVDQDADGQRHAAQGHDVDGLVQRGQACQRTENGQRNGHRDDERGAPASQKDQDHERGQAGGDDRLAHHAVDGAAHKDRLVAERGDLQLRRQLALACRRALARTPVDDVQRGGRAGLHDVHQHARAGRPRAQCWSAAGCRRAHGPRRECRHGAVHGLDGQVVQLGPRSGARSWSPRRTRSGRSSWCRTAQ